MQNKIRSSICLAIFALPLLPSAPFCHAAGSPAATQPATQPAALAPALSAAMAQLSADDYQQRQEAMVKIQATMAAGIREMLLLEDPEARNRMAGIMEYNAALSRWAIEALDLPKQERTTLVQWTLSPQIAPLIGKIYSSHPDQRAEGIKDLAKNTTTEASMMLAHLIENTDRTIRMAAIDAVHDRPVTAPVLNALWAVAIGSAVPAVDYTSSQLVRVGMVANPNRFVAGYGNRSGDANAAVNTLILLKDAGVADRIRTYLIENKDKDLMRTPPGVSNFNNPLPGILVLAEAYQIKEAVPMLMKVINGPAVNSSSFNFNGRPTYITNRIAAIAAICIISGQKFDDYKMRMAPELNQWSVPDAAAESQAVDKLTQWYQAHQADFAATTQPATQGSTAKSLTNDEMRMTNQGDK